MDDTSRLDGATLDYVLLKSNQERPTRPPTDSVSALATLVDRTV